MSRKDQKLYAVPMILEGVSIGMQGLGMLQSHKQAQAAEAQAEDQMIEQRRLQNQQLKAQAQQNQKMMDTLKQVAKTNPAVASTAAGQQMGVMQQNFAIPASISKVAGAIKDLAIVGKEMGAHKRIASGLATGATLAGAGYLADRAIRAKAKRDGIDLGESDKEDQKKSRKILKRAAAVAGTAALAIAGAKNGVLGKTIQESANKYLTKDNAIKVGRTISNGFKDQFVNREAWKNAKTTGEKLKAINKFGVGFTAFAAASPIMKYRSIKQAQREQEAQSSGEQREYGIPARFVKYGKTIRDTVNNLVKSAKGKLALRRIGDNVKKSAVASKDVVTFKEAPVRTILGKISSFWGGGGQEGTAKLTKALQQQGSKSGNELTQRAAQFLDNHKTLAVAGSIGVGSLMFKPWQWGQNAVKTVTSAVDKDANKLEKSQEQQVK